MDIMFEVERHFRPEFLNRLDEVVMFNPLRKDDIKRIIHLQLLEVVNRVKAQGLSIQVDELALEFLIEKGFNEDYGARPMRRAIERFVEDPMAESLLRGMYDPERPILVTVDGPMDKAEALAFKQGESPNPTDVVPAGAGAGS
jgi:ATP-dependent Clp protease ATP-binding subunit ClpC